MFAVVNGKVKRAMCSNGTLCNVLRINDVVVILFVHRSCLDCSLRPPLVVHLAMDTCWCLIRGISNGYPIDSSGSGALKLSHVCSGKREGKTSDVLKRYIMQRSAYKCCSCHTFCTSLIFRLLTKAASSCVFSYGHMLVYDMWNLTQIPPRFFMVRCAEAQSCLRW